MNFNLKVTYEASSHFLKDPGVQEFALSGHQIFQRHTQRTSV